MTDVAPKGELASNTWGHADFVRAIITSVQEHDIPVSTLPTTIDLTGTIGLTCNEVISETLADPKRHERGRTAKVTLDGKLLISSKSQVGDEDSINIMTSLDVLRDRAFPQYARQEYKAMNIHSHGVEDSPPSPTDLAGMVVDVTGGGVIAKIVVTPTIRFLLMRNLSSTTVEKTKAEQVAIDTSNLVLGEQRAEMKKFVEQMRPFGGVNDAQFESHRLKSWGGIQMKYMLDFCRTNNIAVYTAKADNKFVRVII